MTGKINTKVSFPDLIGANGIFSDGDWVESKDQDPNGDVRLIQLADIGIGEFLDKSSRFMTSERAEKLKCTYLKAGDILIARMPDPIGRACVFPGHKMLCVTVVDVCILRPDPKIIDTSWFVHQINSPVFSHEILKWVTGTTRQRISKGNLSKIEISLPPLPEQRRIAAILDKADAIRRKRQQAIRLTEDFLRSVFLDMFGDPVTNPKGWEVVPLGDICDFTAGNSLPGGEPYSEQEDGHLLLKVGDMNLPGNEIFISTAREWTGTYRGRMIAPEGAIILPKRGGAISTNKKRMLTRPALLDPNLMGIYSPEGTISSFYLFQWFQGFDLNEISSGSAVPQLNKQDLAPLKLALPPQDMQEKFESVMKEVLSMKDRLETKGYDDLFNSLVQRAFRGNL